jgi:GT2 family glycosyltransferase
MAWLERSGWQFGYGRLSRFAGRRVPALLQHRFTYTSHISLPRQVALAHPFREDVTLYGWEDVEWGTRLRDAGIPLVYEPAARALHHHHLTLEMSLARMEILGRSAREIAEKVTSFDRVPRGGKRFVYELAALLPTMAGRHRRAFLRGLRSA